MALVHQCDRCGAVCHDLYLAAFFTGDVCFEVTRSEGPPGARRVTHLDLCERCNNDLHIHMDNFMRQKEPVEVNAAMEKPKKKKWFTWYGGLNEN